MKLASILLDGQFQYVLSPVSLIYQELNSESCKTATVRLRSKTRIDLTEARIA
jgi:hypothetical protein